MESTLPYEDLRCVGYRTAAQGGGFLLDFQGAGVNVTFTLDAQGHVEKVQGRDPQQFVVMRGAIELAKQLKGPIVDALKEKAAERGKRPLDELAIDLPDKIIDELDERGLLKPEIMLPAILEFDRKSAEYPRAATFALHNQYMSNLAFQVVVLTPDQAAAEQAGRHRDYAGAFGTLDWKHPLSALNPGRTRLFPSGTKLTPVLDRAESQLPRASGSNAIEPRSLAAHLVKGMLSRKVTVPYIAADSGNETILVQTDDGQFAMLMSGAITEPKILEPYRFEKPPVPLTHEERLFQGSLEEFVAAFPRFVQKAASAAGLNPQSYEKETAYVIEAVRTCAGITAEMGLRATMPSRIEDVRRLGPQYGPCQNMITPVSDAVKQWNRDTERGMVASISPRGGRGWQDRRSISVVVQFTSIKGDPPLRGANGLAALFDAYGVVSAMIPNPAR